MKFIPATTKQQAFSLMELLVVIMIIGFMSALIMLSFGPAREGAIEERDRRNAQEIASTAAMASAAGARFVVKDDETATIQNLVLGKTPVSGVFRGRIFKLPPMEDYQIQGAMKYLALNDTELTYNHQ